MAFITPDTIDPEAMAWINATYPKGHTEDIYNAAYRYGCPAYWLRGGPARERFKKEVAHFFFRQKQDPDFYTTV
jgi:hypothetical protein